MDNQKRMTRFKNIQILEMPIDIIKWYRSIKYSGEEITVFSLHHMIEIDERDSAIFLKDIRKRLSNSELLESTNLLCIIENSEEIEFLKDLLESKKHRELTNKIVERMYTINDYIYKDYLDKLNTKYSEDIFDTIVSVLIITIKRKNIVNEIFELLINDKIRDPQDFAVLAQILGIAITEDKVNYLYSFYKYFINNFPDNNYFEGPLFGISYFLKNNHRTTAST